MCCEKYLKDFIIINTIAPISCENMLRYMSFKDTFCSSKLTAFLKLHAQKTVPKTPTVVPFYTNFGPTGSNSESRLNTLMVPNVLVGLNRTEMDLSIWLVTEIFRIFGIMENIVTVTIASLADICGKGWMFGWDLPKIALYCPQCQQFQNHSSDHAMLTWLLTWSMEWCLCE